MADDNAPALAAPAQPAPPPTAVPPVPREPETFSREYVHELREENKGWRLKADEQTQRARAAEEGAKKAKEDADAAAAKARAEAGAATIAAETAATQRVILAELRTAAVKAGMVDLDGLKLADLSAVKLDDKGEVEGADALMEALKAAKPYLFGQAATPPGNTNPATPPTPRPVTAKKATEMTDAEFDAAMAQIKAGKGVPR